MMKKFSFQMKPNLKLPANIIEGLDANFQFVRGSWGIVPRGSEYLLVVDRDYADFQFERLQEKLKAVSPCLRLKSVSRTRYQDYASCWLIVEYSPETPPRVGRLVKEPELPGLWAFL